jgi:hypothetical protein
VENIFQLYLEPLRKFQLAAEGKASRQPPEHHRERGSGPVSIRCQLVSAV